MLLPNTQEFLGDHRPGLDFEPGHATGRLRWAPRPLWAGVLALMAAAGLLSLSQATEFLYYQF